VVRKREKNLHEESNFGGKWLADSLSTIKIFIKYHRITQITPTWQFIKLILNCYPFQNCRSWRQVDRLLLIIKEGAHPSGLWFATLPPLQFRSSFTPFPHHVAHSRHIFMPTTPRLARARIGDRFVRKGHCISVWIFPGPTYQSLALQISCVITTFHHQPPTVGFTPHTLFIIYISVLLLDDATA